VRYHPRFDSNAWVWPTGPLQEGVKKGNVISLGIQGGIPTDVSLNLFDKKYTSDTTDPWFIVYADTRGGISAATWVIDDADNGIYAFYNTRLLDRYDGSTALEDLMDPIEGLPFSPQQETMMDLWDTLTTVVSPSYESMNDLNRWIKGATITYFASHMIPQSINKLHIGG